MFNLSDLLVRRRWPWHLVFWLMYALSRVLPYYLTVVYYDVRLLRFMLWMELTFVGLVYFTIWLYRYFCAKRRYKTYLLVGLLVWASYVAFFAHSILYFVGDLPDFSNATWDGIFINSSTKYFFTFILLTMAKYLKDNFIQQYYESQQKQLQIASELENLKAQIAPHFLFNTMNNFYGLAVERSEKLPRLMVRLSDLLRYSLYETRQATVPLFHDVSYLRDYIELEKIRLEDSLEFEFESNITDTCQTEIAPLLLVVFVENAFKHAKKVQNDIIRISVRIHLADNGTLTFTVRNNRLAGEEDWESNKKGIGLENVKKRLEVLYPNGLHQLSIEATEGYFQVNLSIKLQNNAA